MNYPQLLQLTGEADYRQRFEQLYCAGPITTFDGIAVRFRKHQFDHCFFESSRRNGVKDLFSVKRAQRIEWIKAALADPKSERYCGWDNKRRQHDASRRVTLVMGNYVVVIAITNPTRDRADFVTAYVADTPGTPNRPSTIDKIRQSPLWA